MYYTYVLLSKSDKDLYIGYTNNLKKRIADHNKGTVQSTRKRWPFKLIYYEACLNELDAKNREKYFKTGYGRRFLKNRLENYKKDLDIQARDGGQGTTYENNLLRKARNIICNRCVSMKLINYYQMIWNISILDGFTTVVHRGES